jgi:probable HAF family extracellular repeat protein
MMLKRLFSILGGLLLLLVLAPTAEANDATAAGAAAAVARSSSWIAVEMPFTGDANGNGHAIVEVGTSAAGPFGGGGVDWTKLTGTQEWRTSIISASPSTTYYVRVTFVDPDGVSGANPQIVGPVITPAASPNAVTVGAATAVLRDAEIFVSVPISDDANRNSGGTVEVATDPAGPWTPKAGSPSEANLPFHPKRARLRGLTPGTDYWIRVTVTDPEGISGANPQVIGPVNYEGLGNLALGKSITADPGWGCCPSPSHLVDGRIQNDAWFYGFAWTGGTTCWAGGCPPGLNKKATIDLGAPTRFNRAAMWYHDPNSVPLVWKFQYSNDGVNFTDAYSTGAPFCRTASEPLNVGWYLPSCAHEATFPPVTARYVRYLFDDSTLFGGLHGWAVEFEVFNAPVSQAPVFSGLSSPTITYGTAEVTLSGTIGGAGVPTGDVEITLDGVTSLAPILPDGSFSTVFDTFTLGAGAYPIAYHYGGDATYESADGAGTLTVAKATPSMRVFGGTFAFDGQPHAALGTVTGVNGEDLGSPSFTYNGSPEAPVGIGVYSVSAAFAGKSNYQVASNEAVSIYINDGTPAPGDVGTYWVTNLGTLGGLFSTATAVNASGQVAGYSETASGEFHAFLYAGGVMSDLGTLGGAYSIATGINASGQVVGYSQTAAGEFHAFSYSGGVMTDLGTLGGADSFAYGVNDSGVVIGESLTASGNYHAFLYAGGVMNDLGTLPGGTYSAANSVNASGQVAGYSETASGEFHAFLYAGGVMSDLGTLPGDSTAAGTGVNDAGQVAGYSTHASGATHAFLHDGQMRDLGVLSKDADFSRASGVGGAGVVGQSVNEAGEARGFVFDLLRGMRDLNPLIPAEAGVAFNEASAVNSAGQIAGAGDAGGQTVALLLTPVLATTTAVADLTTTYTDAAQQLSLTATVSAGGGAVVNEGTVTFRLTQGGSVVGSPVTSAPLSNGTAAVSYTLPAGAGAGDYVIEATYNDGPRFTGSGGSGDLSVLRAATSTALTSSFNPSVYGRSVTFTAAVTCSGASPSGVVEFRDGASVLAAVPLDQFGRATFTTFSLGAGAHPVTAVYAGGPNLLASTSPVLTQTVNQSATTTTLTGPDSSVFGQSVTFNATVAPLPAGPFTPTGQVQFKIDGVNAPGGLRPLVNGQASYSTSNLSLGTHVIAAEYKGDANFKPSSGSKTHRRR